MSATRDFQRRLKALGFDPGAVDGVVGPRTLRAAFAALDALEARCDAPEMDEETRRLVAELERDEGRVLHAYQDHLGYWTIGIGRLIDKRKGGGISNAEADHLKMNDVAKVRGQLDQKLPWWRGLDPVRQRALQNMCFQLGISGLLGFRATLAALEARDYARAAANMRRSLWARQTPARAERVIQMIERGVA